MKPPRAIALSGELRAASHDVVAVVPSMSRTGTGAYRILRDRGTLICECPAFAYGRLCKHVRLYEYARAQMARCRQDHGVAEQTLCAACLLRVLVKAAKRVQEMMPKRPRGVPALPAGDPAVLPAGTRVAYRSSSGVRLAGVIAGRAVVGRNTAGYVVELDEGQCLDTLRTRHVAWYTVREEGA